MLLHYIDELLIFIDKRCLFIDKWVYNYISVKIYNKKVINNLNCFNNNSTLLYRQLNTDISSNTQYNDLLLK